MRKQEIFVRGIESDLEIYFFQRLISIDLDKCVENSV